MDLLRVDTSDFVNLINLTAVTAVKIAPTFWSPKVERFKPSHNQFSPQSRLHIASAYSWIGTVSEITYSLCFISL